MLTCRRELLAEVRRGRGPESCHRPGTIVGERLGELPAIAVMPNANRGLTAVASLKLSAQESVFWILVDEQKTSIATH